MFMHPMDKWMHPRQLTFSTSWTTLGKWWLSWWNWMEHEWIQLGCQIRWGSDTCSQGNNSWTEICYMSTWTSLYDNFSVKHLNYVTSAIPHEQAVVSLAVFAIINLSLFLYHVDLFNFIICIPFWVLENTTRKSWKFHQFMWIWKLSTSVI